MIRRRAGEGGQTLLLGRTFFGRMFESDLMPADVPQEQLLLWSMAALTTPGLAVPMIFTPKYSRIIFRPGALEPAIAVDRLILVTLSMIAIGVAALILWEGVFPDRRDGRILSPLPVRTRTFVLARLGALFALFGLFTAAVTLLPAVLFPMIVAGYVAEPNPFLGMAAQFMAVAAGCAFTFFSLIALQCSLLVVLGRAVAQRVSVVLQVLFTIGLLQMVLLIPRLGLHVRGGQLAPEWLASSSVFLLPPAWFVALYETISGTGTPEAARLAVVAGAVAVGPAALTLVLYAASYTRLTRQALETPPPPRRAGVARRAIEAVTAAANRAPAWLLGGPVERAVSAFALRTLVRSRQHRMLLAIYIAVALALVVSTILPMVLGRSALLTQPHIAVGSTTPVLVFFMLVGMRMLFSIPVEPRARWALRAGEPIDRYAAVNGARRAMVLAGLLPCILLTLVGLAPLWGFAAAARHALFCTVMGFVLAEILLLTFAKIPFSCTYLPSSTRLKAWPAYAFGFIWYAYAMTILEFIPLKSVTALTVFYLATAIAIVALRRLRARWLAELPGIVFEEGDPGALFQGFRLSEGFAATKAR